jgi:hypothetical protein
VLLAFTTFVGLGGDDVLKTIVMICLGLVLSTVGLDLISGQPRLIFGDMPGFYAGISFLVLAIGVYGVGEVLWTIETSRTAPMVTPARITFREMRARLREMNKLWKTMSFGSLPRLLRRHAAGGGGDAGLAHGLRHRQETSKKPETFGKGNIEGVAAPGDREQRRLHRLAPADADARHPRLAHHRAAARRHGDVGADAGADALHRAARFRLGADLVALHGERGGGAHQHRADPALRLGAADAVHDALRDRARALHRRRLRAQPEACTTSG